MKRNVWVPVLGLILVPAFVGLGLVFSAGAIVSPATGQAIGGSFQGLGDLPGGDFASLAWGGSADGTAVTGDSDSGYPQAFFWTQATGMVPLPLLPGREQNSHGDVLSANSTKVAGWCGWEILGWEACVWTFDGTQWTVEGLGDLAGGKYKSHAHYMTPNGNVVVGQGNSDKCPLACRWLWDGAVWVLQAIEYASGRSYWSLAMACSDDGSIIVGERCKSMPIAFRWTKAKGMVDLGVLPKMKCSSAGACSADGSVVAGLSYPTLGARSSGLAFRWTAATGMVGLGDLPGGSFFSEAVAVSADGSIVVGRSGTANGNEAFIWDAANGMRRVTDELVTNGVFMPAGWTLQEARSIAVNAGVVTIVGWGINPDGYTEAWRAVIGQ